MNVLYTIYRHSREFPHSYVVRRWAVNVTAALIDTSLPLVIAPTLEDARTMLPKGLICFPRDESDDPAIVESWM